MSEMRLKPISLTISTWDSTYHAQNVWHFAVKIPLRVKYRVEIRLEILLGKSRYTLCSPDHLQWDGLNVYMAMIRVVNN